VQLTLRLGGRVLCISLCRASAHRDIEAARASGAKPLKVGEWLGADAAGAYLVELEQDQHAGHAMGA
jgi:hypothetical protein